MNSICLNDIDEHGRFIVHDLTTGKEWHLTQAEIDALFASKPEETK